MSISTDGEVKYSLLLAVCSKIAQTIKFFLLIEQRDRNESTKEKIKTAYICKTFKKSEIMSEVMKIKIREDKFCLILTSFRKF
jgi:hypothetical protein